MRVPNENQCQYFVQYLQAMIERTEVQAREELDAGDVGFCNGYLSALEHVVDLWHDAQASLLDEDDFAE